MEKEAVKINRFSNLDLLRIFSMFLIVFLHSIDHSGVLEQALKSDSLFTFSYVYFVYFLCQTCVNLFVLLSGFFLIDSEFKSSKLFNLWVETVFYSLVIKIVFMATGQISLSITSLVSCFIPVFTGRYWFITIYFGMYLLSPFMNLLVNNLSSKKITLLCSVLFGLMSVWVSFSPSIKGMNSGAGWGLAWFCVLYFTGAWLKRCYVPKNHKTFRYLLLWLAISAAVVILLVCFRNKPSIFNICRNLYRYDSAPAYISTLVVFIAFLNLKISGKMSQLLQKVSVATFGVYLIHAHANIISWVWTELTKIADYTHLTAFPLIHVCAVLAVFMICTLLSLCCGKLVKWIRAGLYNTYLSGVCSKIDALFRLV